MPAHRVIRTARAAAPWLIVGAEVALLAAPLVMPMLAPATCARVALASRYLGAALVLAKAVVR